MAADPTSFDHFRRGEPPAIQGTKVDPTSFDHFRRGEPVGGLIPAPAASPPRVVILIGEGVGAVTARDGSGASALVREGAGGAGAELEGR